MIRFKVKAVLQAWLILESSRKILPEFFWQIFELFRDWHESASSKRKTNHFYKKLESSWTVYEKNTSYWACFSVRAFPSFMNFYIQFAFFDSVFIIEKLQADMMIVSDDNFYHEIRIFFGNLDFNTISLLFVCIFWRTWWPRKAAFFGKLSIILFSFIYNKIWLTWILTAASSVLGSFRSMSTSSIWLKILIQFL